MAEPRNFTFEYKELAETLVKKQGIHEGFWGVVFELGLGGGIIPFPPGSDTTLPVAMVPIRKVGIQRFDEPNPMTIDAAKVNPKRTEKQAAGKAN